LVLHVLLSSVVVRVCCCECLCQHITYETYLSNIAAFLSPYQTNCSNFVLSLHPVANSFQQFTGGPLIHAALTAAGVPPAARRRPAGPRRAGGGHPRRTSGGACRCRGRAGRP